MTKRNSIIDIFELDRSAADGVSYGRARLALAREVRQLTVLFGFSPVTIDQSAFPGFAQL
jgi:hypothetical protein